MLAIIASGGLAVEAEIDMADAEIRESPQIGDDIRRFRRKTAAARRRRRGPAGILPQLVTR